MPIESDGRGQRGGVHHPEDWRTNTDRSLFNPTLLVAETLAEIGFDVRVSRYAVGQGGHLGPAFLAIYATGVGREAMNKISINTVPELHVLWRLYNIGEFPRDDFHNSQWDEETKDWVMGTYYYRKSRKLAKFAREETHAHQRKIWTQMEQEFGSLAELYLGDRKPMQSKDIRKLVKEVVDRELPVILNSPTSNFKPQ